MRILVVDDEAGKRQQIVDFLQTLDGVERIDEAMSYQGAMAALRAGTYDWVILDMRLTTYDVSPADDGGRPRNFGGDEVLRKMARRGISSQVVVLTQYTIFRRGRDVLSLSAVSERLSRRYPSFVGLVQFRHSSDTWKEELALHLLEQP